MPSTGLFPDASTLNHFDLCGVVVLPATDQQNWSSGGVVLVQCHCLQGTTGLLPRSLVCARWTRILLPVSGVHLVQFDRNGGVS